MQTVSQGRQRVVRERACVLYDKTTGAIRHIQHVLVMEGGYDPKDHEIEAMCREALRKRGHAYDATDTLHVGREAFQPFKVYKVDPARKALVDETPRRRR
jgi:hypothetical protein